MGPSPAAALYLKNRFLYIYLPNIETPAMVSPFAVLASAAASEEKG
jgi:hypothetical protein